MNDTISAVEIEKGIIATIMCEADSGNKEPLNTVLANGITEDDFTDKVCRKVFERMTKHGEMDSAIICTVLTGCQQAIAEMQKYVGMYCDFTEKCAKLKECSIRRAFLNAAHKMENLTHDLTSDFHTEFIKYNAAMLEQQSRLEVRECKSQSDLFIDCIEAMGNGRADKDVIKYGLPIDKYVKHRRSEVFTLGAAPETGKTMFALSAMLNMALEGKKVILFCDEMPFGDLNMRLISNLANIPYNDVQEGRVLSPDSRKQAFTTAAGKLQSLYEHNTMRILGSGQYTHSSTGIEAELQRFYSETGRVDFFCVDYIQRVIPSRDSKDEVGRISAAMSEITSLAVKFNAAALVLSQLSRSGQQQGGNRYSNTNLKGSSQIEQDSSIIAMLFKKEGRDDVREFRVTKARNFKSGGGGSLIFEGDYARFSPYSQRQYNDEPCEVIEDGD